MFRKIFPKNDEFFDFFERHAKQSVKAAHELFKISSPGYDLNNAFHNIKSCEQEGDRITHQCMEALHKNFITPIDRSAIHHLISKMDDILDEIEDVAKFIIVYKLPHLPEKARKLPELIVSSTLEVELALKELRKMKNTKTMQEHFVKINHFENEADNTFIQVLALLFEEEKDILTIIKWKEVYEHLEQACDMCEDVANILEGIVLEYD